MYRLLALLLIASTLSCSGDRITALPYLGNTTTNAAGETIHHKIRPFVYHNQDSVLITNQTFAGKPYIADFFFTSCPSICPRVTKQMLRLYDRYKDDDIKLVSFTLDPKRDHVQHLHNYAKNLEVSASKWLFLTGDKDFTLDLADDYFVAAYEDPDAPGGFDHSGKIILVDGEGHVRAFAEGTDPEDVTDFFKSVDFILGKKK